MMDTETIPIYALTAVIIVLLWILAYRHRGTKELSLKTRLGTLTAKKYRELIKNDYSVTKLQIVGVDGKPIKKPFKLRRGHSNFRCLATYSDGSVSEYSPYWLLWIIYPRYVEDPDPYGTLGPDQQEEVSIYAAPNHVKYSELSCWVLPPNKESQSGNKVIPHDSTDLDYTGIS